MSVDQAVERLRNIGRTSEHQRARRREQALAHRQRVMESLPAEMRNHLSRIAEAFGRPQASCITAGGEVLYNTLPDEPVAVSILPYVPEQPLPWSPGQPEDNR